RGEGADEPDARRKRQREHRPGSLAAREDALDQARGGGERREEGAGRDADAHAGRAPEERPLQGADEERRVLGVPAALVGQAGRLELVGGLDHAPSSPQDTTILTDAPGSGRKKDPIISTAPSAANAQQEVNMTDRQESLPIKSLIMGPALVTLA